MVGPQRRGESRINCWASTTRGSTTPRKKASCTRWTRSASTWPRANSSASSARAAAAVDVARLTGCTNRRNLFRHILPYLVSVVLVYTSLGLATTILFEATLSYIGLGVQPPTPSWCQMISEGQAYYLSTSHLVIYPGLAITVTVLAFNLVGDGLRDAFDLQQRRR
jgi:ABC-type dipeptide/oligopeptide/nickel transport system permease subunit